MSRVTVLGVDFDPVTVDEAAARALDLMEARRGAYICTPNPEIVMLARRDPSLLAAVNGADLSLPDGVGIVWAAGRLGCPVPERAAGYDLLLALLGKMRGSVYILGGRPGIAVRAGENITARYPGVSVAGTHDGYFTDEAAVLEEIRASAPDLLLVCLGAPRQELWMAAHRDLPVGLMAGLGGSVDVLAGASARAPLWWRERGLEWLWRLLREPRRIRRQLRLPLYMALVLAEARRK